MRNDQMMTYIEAWEYLTQTYTDVVTACEISAKEFSEAMAEIYELAATTCKTWQEAAAELAESWAAALPGEEDYRSLAGFAQDIEKSVEKAGGTTPRSRKVIGRPGAGQPGSMNLNAARKMRRLPRSE